MTREQVADFVLFELKAYESRGLIAPPSMQTVADQEKREAMFCHIKSWWDYSSGIFFSGYLTSVCLGGNSGNPGLHLQKISSDT